MKTLYKNATLIDTASEIGSRTADVVVENEYIISLCGDLNSKYDRTVDCTGLLMIPGMYNAHCHSAMTMFRGYAEDLPLHRWLNEKIFPAEELWKAKPDLIYTSSMLACAEMMRAGIVSFTDMYEECAQTAAAVVDSGMKANVGRAVLSFDDDENPNDNRRFNEGRALAEAWHGAANGRIRVDIAPHAEYTNKVHMLEAAVSYAAAHKLGIHMHISETAAEHEECIERHGVTPIGLLSKIGALRVPVSAAHCVFVSDDDIALMKAYDVTALHNPVSNLKLGSGVMPMRKLLDAGVSIALGTDGVSSNNTHDMFMELRLAAILHKGVSKRADETTAVEMLPLIAENGAKSQGRPDCGKIDTGYRADITLVDFTAPNTTPVWNAVNTLVYSVNSSNVVATICDGVTLYERGEYKTIDIEKVNAAMRYAKTHYFD